MISRELWKRYSNLYDKFTPNHQKDLLQFVAQNLEGKVLDLGMGVGKLIPYINDFSFVRSYTGVEQNKDMFELAKKKTLDNNFDSSLYLGDLSNLNTLNLRYEHYDSLVLLNVLYSNDNPIEILKKTKEKLIFGGKILISEPGRVVYPEKLLEAMNREFLNDPDYKEYVEINKQLVGSAVTYNLDEMSSLLEILGFDVEEKSNDFFLGSNITLIARNVEN